jgi:hypothetical protein
VLFLYNDGKWIAYKYKELKDLRYVMLKGTHYYTHQRLHVCIYISKYNGHIQINVTNMYRTSYLIQCVLQI